MPEDDPRNDLMLEVAGRLNLPTVATNNVHYHRPSEADLSEVLAAIDGRRSLDLADGFRPATDERFLKSPADMEARFSRYRMQASSKSRGPVEAAARLGQSLTFDLRLIAPRLPDFPMPGHFRDEMEYLRHLTWESAREIYPGHGEGMIEPGARTRLEHELGIIERLGFAGYFLVVWDIVNFARDQDIYCQIRGSGADSAVCRCLRLTRVDPIRLGLPFERFLSEERGRPPDIDLDLEADRREEVIQYCYRRYGRERAAMVANVITYRARSVLRDVGKTFGFTQAQVDGLTKYVDTHDPAQLRLDAPLPSGLTADLIYDICWRLDGFPRHLGIHSGGMVIADRPLFDVVPLEWGRMEDRTVLQWDKDDCAAIGIVKFDLLGLGMLNALHLTSDLIKQAHGVEIDLATIPQEPAIYRMLTRSDTVGLFQVESRAQMATLPKMKPRTFYDLAVEVALIRPGPIQGQSVHPYLRRRNGEEPVSYPHPAHAPDPPKDHGSADLSGTVDGACSGLCRFRWWSIRPAASGDDPQAIGKGDGALAGGGVRRHGFQGSGGRSRRRDLGEAAGLCPFWFSGEPFGQLRLHRLHVGLVEVPLAGGNPGGSAQCPTHGFLQPQLIGAGCPPSWGGGARTLYQPLVSRLHDRGLALRSR